LALGVGLRAQAVLGGVSPEVIYHATYYRLDGLAVGALLATIVRDPRRAVRLRAWTRPILAGAACPLGILAVWQQGFWRDQPVTEIVGYLAVALAFGALVTAVVVDTNSSNAVSRVFSVRPLCVLGQLSFAIYLFHWPVAAWVKASIYDSS